MQTAIGFDVVGLSVLAFAAVRAPDILGSFGFLLRTLIQIAAGSIGLPLGPKVVPFWGSQKELLWGLWVRPLSLG